MMMFARWAGLLLVSLAALSGCRQEPEESLPAVRLAVTGDCHIGSGCTVADDAISIVLRFETLPRALRPFPVSLRINTPDNARAVYATFSMQGMDMGLNRYRLIKGSGKVWKGDVTLPVCVSGRSDWLAEFELVMPTRRVLVQAPFVLNK